MAGYGMKSHALFNFQDSYGASQVDSFQAVPFVSESLTDNIEQIIEASMYSRFAQSPSHAGLRSIEGDIQAEANPVILGHMLKSTVGLTSTTSDTGTQTHVFQPRQADFDERAATDPLTLEIYRDQGSAFLYSDMCGNTLGLSVANGELLAVTLGLLGGNVTKQAGSTPIFPVAKPFKWDQVSASYNGVAVVDLVDLTINYNNNLSNKYTMQNTNTPRKTKRDNMYSIEIAGTMIFQDHIFYDAYTEGQEAPFVINWASQEAPNTLKIDFPLLRFKQVTPVAGGPGMIEVPFTADAKFSVTSNTDMTITLVNTQEYY